MDFLAEYQKLKKFQPRVFTHSLHNENCDWGDYVYRSKNCYLCFDSTSLVDCGYCYDSFKLTDCYDCDHGAECELCYGCNDGFKLFGCTFCDDCSWSTDCHFCVRCENCEYCFGCVGLKFKKYCIFNRQLTKKEYFNQLRYWQDQPVEKIFREIGKIKPLFPRPDRHASHDENSDFGDYVYYVKNCYYCFDAPRNEDCGYLFDSARNKNCFDMNQGFRSELSYEINDSARIYNSSFIDYCADLADCDLMYNCANCHDCLGCVGLKHQKYCILNRQLSKEEYFKKVKEIKRELFGRV